MNTLKMKAIYLFIYFKIYITYKILSHMRNHIEKKKNTNEIDGKTNKTIQASSFL